MADSGEQNVKSNIWTPSRHGVEAPQAIKPVVFSGAQIEAMPKENFSGDQTRATGGWKQIFDNPTTPTNELNLGMAYFPPRKPGQESFEALHRHKQAEFYYMLKGECTVKIEGVEYECKPGHALFIPGDAEHGFWNTSETEELVFLWGFACNGFNEVVYRFSEGVTLINEKKT